MLKGLFCKSSIVSLTEALTLSLDLSILCTFPIPDVSGALTYCRPFTRIEAPTGTHMQIDTGC